MSDEFADFLKRTVLNSGRSSVFVRAKDGLSPGEVEMAEKLLGIDLPPSYKLFVSTIGHGIWCGEIVKRPSGLYAFDSDCEDMEGFVALVENAGGVGDYLAINPSDPATAGERPVYYCGHDPFGYEKVAGSFEDWVRGALDKMEDRLGKIGTKKPWWQFWS
jgi:hypothetical protein